MNQPPYAEYPRPGGSPLIGRGPGVYFEAIGEAWNLIMKDLGHWIAATIVWIVLTYALSIPLSLLMQAVIPTQPRFDQLGSLAGLYAVFFVLNLIPTAISATLIVGMVVMGVRKARGEYINVGMIFEPFRRFGSVVGASGLYYIVTLAAALALFLPFLYFAPVLVLMPVVAYLKGVGPIEALGLTFDACKGYWASLLALCIVLTLIYCAGFLACCVGFLVTFPLICVVLAIHYRAFFEPAAPTTMPGPDAYP